MATHWYPAPARSLVLSVAAILLIPAAALGQAASPSPALEPAASPSIEDAARVPVLFAVAPTDPADRTLTLLVDKHDCGKRLTKAPASTSITETSGTIGVRVEVRTDPDGRVCSRDTVLRLKVALDSPLGERAVIDAARPAPALVNRFDPPDLGYEYSCSFGAGPGFTYAQLQGPGHDISNRGIPTTLEGARAMVDDGDQVILRGHFGRRGSVIVETWRLRGDHWKRQRKRCTLKATSPDGLDTASWRLRGPRPEPDSKNLEVWVQEWACASGNPPVGRVVPPVQVFKRDALYIIFRTFPISRSWEANERSRETGTASAGSYAFVDCNGAPPAPYKVKLWWQLDGRTLYDAAYFPPQERKERNR